MNLRLERTVHESDDGSSALAEAALRSPLLDGMSDSIILHDLEGNIFYANEAACNTRGYERAELLGMNLKDLNMRAAFPTASKRSSGAARAGSRP
jgi:PAS domain S-box-containing protein